MRKYLKYKSRYDALCHGELGSDPKHYPCIYHPEARLYLPSRDIEENSQDCICSDRGNHLVRLDGKAGLRVQLHHERQKTKDSDILSVNESTSFRNFPEDLKKRLGVRFGQEKLPSILKSLETSLRRKSCKHIAMNVSAPDSVDPTIAQEYPGWDYETEAKPFFDWCCRQQHTHKDGCGEGISKPLDKGETATRIRKIRKDKLTHDVIAELTRVKDPSVNDPAYVQEIVDDTYRRTFSSGSSGSSG